MINSSAESIRVLAAVVEDSGRYLVCQRPSHKRHGGLWEFPGGKLEAGETLLMAARREMLEELTVEVTNVGPTAFCAADPDSPFVIEFVPTSIAGTPVCQEHTDLKWATLVDLDALNLAPSDRQFVRFLLDRQ